MEAMLDRLGLRRPPYMVAQVVGSNGKGSTSVMLASLVQRHSLKVGLHTSPHFVSVRERVRVNGAMLPEHRWQELANTLMEHGGEELSYFEFVTSLSILAFAEECVDLAVMETGLGGMYDATTALAADVLLYTPIALEHQLVLGPRLKDIATDKAGAIRSGASVFSAVQQPEAMEQLERTARERAAPLHVVSPLTELPDQTRFPMRLAGEHQHDNARLALTAWRHVRTHPALSGTARQALAEAEKNGAKESLEGHGLAEAWIPGRLQRVPPLPADPGSPRAGWPPLILDGAHNSHGMAALSRALANRGIAPAAVIFACLLDKDLKLLLPHLRVLATGPIYVPPIPDNPRALAPEELAAEIGLNAVPTRSLQEALDAASTHIADRLPESFSGKFPNNPLLICGSLYLLGEFYSLRPDTLQGSADIFFERGAAPSQNLINTS